jgi:alpha-glucosidase
MTTNQVTHTDVTFAGGATLRVTPITPHVFRIRLRADGQFPEPGLVRYGVVKSDWPQVPVTVAESSEAVTLDTGAASLTVNRTDGRLALRNGDGAVLLEEVAAPQSDPATGFRAEFALREGERLYGLGDETRDCIQKRGHEAQMVLLNVTCYAPIPFLMSTGGWAIFLNSTWFHHVDVGATQPDRLVYHAGHGDLDYYLIAGESLPLLLDRYTEISGRPAVLPMWAYGLTFVCDERGVRARDVLYEAHTFRQEGFPCDLIGLEPDWMETYYDFSVNKKWSPERFHAPEWLPHRKPGGFTAALYNMGFKLSLWLCMDYDVSEYEERLVRGAEAMEATEARLDSLKAQDRYEEDVIRDPHFHPRYFDNITQPGEPWFEHLKKFVDDGAAAFKLDGSNQVSFHPDRKWYNGMSDEEMHNFYPVLYGKQMHNGFKEYTGRRPMIYSADGYAGIQQYAATWAGDTGGGAKPLTSLLNHGLSGHSNTSCDLQVWNREGIHFGCLVPWAQILSWHQYNQPWFLPPDIYEVLKFYVRLRYRLLPYLYSAAHVAARTGMPMMRAMPLVAPDDPASEDLVLQYMLGEWLLTCSFTDMIHLPAGRWIDYWTGEVVEGPLDRQYTAPENRGGPLFVKAGAILPLAPPMEFVGQVSMETMGLEVFPYGESAFTLVEDDGVSYAYLAGKQATTEITCQAEGEEVTLTIGPRRGDYEGMPGQRVWEVSLHLDAAPATVLVNEVAVPESGEDCGWDYDSETRVLSLKVTEDQQRRGAAVVRCRGIANGQ